jgi:hypothetical protein
MDEYERIRTDPRQFCVLKEHVIHGAEEIEWEADRFAIVAKKESAAAEVATRADPRRQPPSQRSA